MGASPPQWRIRTAISPNFSISSPIRFKTPTSSHTSKSFIGRSRPRQISASYRKAAILNQARRKGWTNPSPNLPQILLDTKKVLASPLKDINFEDVRGEADEVIARRLAARKQHQQPSPLGLSNYAAFDDWHGYGEEADDDFDEFIKVPEADEGDEIYSDFNFLDPDSTVPKEDDHDDAFAVMHSDFVKTDGPSHSLAAASLDPLFYLSPNWQVSQMTSTTEVC